MSFLPDLDWQAIGFFAFLLLPGFVSILVYGLFRPQQQKGLKDSLFEAMAFGSVNIALLWWTLPSFNWALSQGGWWICLAYGLAVIGLFMGPAAWAIGFVKTRELAEGRGYILRSDKTAWDHFFLAGDPCWVIVHLHDGRQIGGLYSEKSYASFYPDSGDIYLEEIWRLDDQGAFVAPIPDTKGMVLCKGDYHIIEFKRLVFESDSVCP